MKGIISVVLYILILAIAVKGTDSVINDIWNKRLEKKKRKKNQISTKNNNNL